MFTLKLKKFVDHTAKIAQRVEKEIDRRYKRAGSIIRGIGRRLVRRTKKANSPPGKPPRTHVQSGEIGLKAIVWHYDDNRRLLSVGPVSKPGENGEVLEALAFGGTSTIYRRDKTGKKTRIGRFRIRKRPHMELAGEIFEKKFPDLLEDLY